MIYPRQFTMPRNSAKLEVCIDTVQGLRACQTGVDTIELCSALSVGGLTPSSGLIAAARESAVPVHAMVRPRAGGFVYSEDDILTVLGDLTAVRNAGLAGAVVGAATPERKLDISALTRIADEAGDLGLTLHRVIDTLLDPLEAIEQVIDLGFKRILTSGGQTTAQEGVEQLRQMHERAAGRIEIVVGSGVNIENVKALADATGARSFHASCGSEGHADPLNESFGFAPKGMRFTDAAKIAELRTAIDALE
ncbi:copper homeostasis protein CutC [Falsihalocynthiibacter sp. SS001]|uniref:copper homeostasis protein CutC n=1 Tax=Falsihalocynthiibacter sp. SS001 TaxID=3349698 RepID=UPI0036D36215